MKIKDGFILREIAGANVVVPVGENMVKFSNMITLSDTAAFIWKALSEQELNREQILQLIVDEYEVGEEAASADLDKFIGSLLKANVLDE
ncbi:MAG TPA: PqqD family protein [Syntrophomonadaceae bacterium]|nr:PqqD family protein [Syntrophomonadaceae bacterium]